MPTASTVTEKPTNADETARRGRRAARLDARRVLWTESRLERVRSCGHHGILPTGNVVVKATGTGSDRRAGFSGLATCGSTWACPVCSHKISAGRADEIAAAISAWTDKVPGGRIALATFTMQHHKGQSLADLWAGQSTAWGKVTSGRGWKDDQALYGVPMPRTVKTGHRKGQTVVEDRVGWVRAVESTYGDNGWHLHIHVVLFLRDGVDQVDAETLGYSMFQRWRSSLVRQGFRAPTLKHGVDVKLMEGDASQALGEYFTKSVYSGPKAAAMETTMGQHKTARRENRTPFQILADVVSIGDADDLDRWHEWEKASHGRRQLTWSTGLREWLFDGQDEATDQELAEDDALDGDDLVEMDAATWAKVRHLAPMLLDLAEADDTGATLRDFLRIDWPIPRQERLTVGVRVN